MLYVGTCSVSLSSSSTTAGGTTTCCVCPNCGCMHQPVVVEVYRSEPFTVAERELPPRIEQPVWRRLQSDRRPWQHFIAARSGFRRHGCECGVGFRNFQKRN